MSDSAARPWYVAAFGDHYRGLYASRDDESATREARFAAKAVGLRAGERWLDAACGDGRHAVELRALGAAVVGFDLSRPLLAAARARGLTHLARADLRSPPFADATFDVAALFFTSFGYFDDAENRRVLQELRRVLRTKGRLFVDLPDTAHLRRTLVPESVVPSASGVTRLHRRFAGNRVEKDVEIIPRDGGETIRYTESVRLYDRTEFEALLDAEGFAIRAVAGGFDGRPCGAGDRALFAAEARA